MNSPIASAQPIYEADTTMVHSIQQCRQQLHHICRQYMHRRVRIVTIHNEQHEGMLVGFDEHQLYLSISSSSCSSCMGTRQPFLYGGPVPVYNPYANVILPLVLFNLLTISLL